MATLLGGLVAAGVAWLLIEPRLVDLDVWWHLASARELISSGIPRHDPFSHTAAGRAWVDFEWLFQLGLYAAWRLAGPAGLYGLCAAAAAGSGGLLFLFCRSVSGGRSAVALGTALLAIPALSSRAHPRPELVAALALPAIGLLTMRWLATGRTIWIASAVGVMVTWGNSHTSFPVGVGLHWLLVLGALALSFPDRPAPPVRRLLIGALAVAAAPFLTPYLGHTIGVLLAHAGPGDAMAFVAEWRPLADTPLSLADPGHRELAVALWLMLPVAFAAALAAGRPVAALPLSALALAAIAIALRHQRFVALAGLLVAPAVSQSISLAFQDSWPHSRRAVSGALLAAGFAAAGVALAGSGHWPPGPAGIPDGRNPEGLVRFIETVRPARELYNLYNDGGYLIWRLHPDYPVAIDGRTLTVYTPEEYFAYRMTDVDLDTFAPWAERYRIATAIVKRTPGRLCSRLSADPEWAAVYLDGSRALFIRVSHPANRPIADRYGLGFDPCRSALQRLDGSDGLSPEEADAALAALGRMLAVSPNDGLRNLTAALALRRHGPRAAVDLFPEGPATDNSAGLTIVALARERLGDLPGAIGLRRIGAAVEGPAGLPHRRELGRLLAASGEWPEAYAVLAGCHAEMLDDAPADLYYLLGISAAALGRWNEADRWLGRAVLLEPGRSDWVELKAEAGRRTATGERTGGNR